MELAEISTYSRSLLSPFGHLKIVCSDEHLLQIHFDEMAEPGSNSNDLCERVSGQLQEYFNGTLKAFDLPLSPIGTEFQKRVWNELVTVPYGQTHSYLDLAKRLGDEKVIRAAASANGKNPIPIVIPCHRIIGSDGSMVGYSGGSEKKRWLLQHEGALVQPELF